MSIKARKLKNDILKSGKKVGILIAEESNADQFITSGTKVAADLVNGGERQAKRIAKVASSKIDELRAKIHSATAPRSGKS